MAVTSGHRVRLRRVRDGAILYDSQTAVASVGEQIVDTAAFDGVETYVLEVLRVLPQGASYDQLGTPVVHRQSLSALVVRR